MRTARHLSGIIAQMTDLMRYSLNVWTRHWGSAFVISWLSMIGCVVMSEELVIIDGAQYQIQNYSVTITGIKAVEPPDKWVEIKYKNTSLRLPIISVVESRAYDGLCLVWDHGSAEFEMRSGYPYGNKTIVELLALSAQQDD